MTAAEWTITTMFLLLAAAALTPAVLVSRRYAAKTGYHDGPDGESLMFAWAGSLGLAVVLVALAAAVAQDGLR